jgi:SNF2 family DNA or RNA helicase
VSPTPIRIEVRDDGRIEVDISFREKELLKRVPGARWDSGDRVWTVPMSYAACIQLRGIFEDRLTIGPRLEQMAMETFEGRVRPALELRTAADAPWIDEPKLTPLQRASVGFGWVADSYVEGDPMGAGKTPMTVCTLKRDDAPYPTCVVSPNGVKTHWRSQFATWWPDSSPRVSIVSGNAKQRREAIDVVARGEADILVINWEVILKHSRVAGFGNNRLSDKEKEPKELNAIKWQMVVADEVHRAKTPKAKQTRALWAIGDGARRRVGLTGTPLTRTPEDLWAVMRFIAPTEYPSKVAFLTRYGQYSFSALGYQVCVGLRGDTKDELFKFFDPRFIRRPKELILPELPGSLPPMRRIVDLKPAQKKAYKKLKEEMIVQLDGGVLMAANPLQQFIRLRQLCAATGEIEVEQVTAEDGSVHEKTKVTLKEPSSKLDELEAVLEDLDEDDRTIAFAESRQLIELAYARLVGAGYQVGMFIGTQTAEQNENERERFQAGELDVLLLTYGAGAEGVDLSRASVNVKLEHATRMEKDEQADERSVRPGQTVPTRHVRILAADTVDFAVEERNGDKVAMLEEVCRDEETLRAMLVA